MKKLFFIAVVGLGFGSQAQKYYNGIGIGYNLGLYKLDYSSSLNGLSSTSALGAPMINYKATMAFEGSGSSAFAVSAYPGLGGMVSQTSGSLVAYQLPVLGELYIGDMEESNFHLGAGFAVNGLFTDSDGGIILGPQFAIGTQFLFKDNVIFVRGAYTYGINKSKDIPDGATVNKDSKSLISLGLHYMFGLK